jgi:DNA processing protein
MSTLPGFWHGAAALSGRLDLSLARQSHTRLATLSDSQLRCAGVCDRHRHRLRSAPVLSASQPAITLDDTAYPAHLAAIPYAPPVLFYRGDLRLIAEPSVAIIGARRCTQRGRHLANQLAHGLSAAGLVIVSGLAYGIDEAAHAANPGRSIAVLGQGLEAPMSSRQNLSVQTILEAGGLVLSEFLPRFPASKFTFPQRNRIISGLSLGTVVVEATLRSGSRITARHAMEQGREVMVVPGHPFDSASTGCNELITQGAGLIRSVDDILNQLGIDDTSHRSTLPTCSVQRAVLTALKTGESLDHIAAQTGADIPALLVSIQALELTGHVVRLPGDRLTLRNRP